MAKVSVLVPAFNEVESVPKLLETLGGFVRERKLDWEVVFVDDGSTDGTYEAVMRHRDACPGIIIRRHGRRLGKTQALVTAASSASGEIFVLFDADLQYTPEDALRLASRAQEGYDIVAGVKTGDYRKRFVSWVYNRLTGFLFSVDVKDMNAMKALRRDAFFALPLRKEWHRYIVPLGATLGMNIIEEPVTLRERFAGKGKYASPFRAVVGLFDLVSVRLLTAVLAKPLLYIGLPGAAVLTLGVLVGLFSVYLRLVGHGFRPLLYLVMLLVLAGLMLVVMAFVGEFFAGLNDTLNRLDRKWHEARRSR